MHDSTYLYQNSDNTTSLYETSNDATIILEQGSRGLTGATGATGATGVVGPSSNQMSALKRWHQQFGKAREGLVTGGASKYVTDVLWVGDSIGEGYNSNVSNTTMVNVFTDNISKFANINGRSGRWVPAGGDWLTSPKFSDQDSTLLGSHTITSGAFPSNEVFLNETYATSIFPTTGNATIFALYVGSASISYTDKRNNGGKTVLTGVTINSYGFYNPSIPTLSSGATVYFGGDDTLTKGFSLRSRNLLPIAGQNIGDTATLEFTGDNVIVYYRKIKFLTGNIQFSLELKDSSGVYQPFYTSSSIYTYKSTGASYAQDLVAWNAATAYGSSMPRGDYRLKVYNYASSIFTVSGTSVAAAGTYTGVTQSATSGIGSGAVFTIVKTGSGTTYTSSNTTVTVTTNGVGYQSGDTITIPGASLGGATPTNNLTLTCSANYSVSFDGAYVCDGNTDQGVRVWNSSKYGTNFSSFNSNVDTTYNADWLSALRNALVNPSLVVIALGTNESANPTTIESGLIAMVNSINDAYAVGYPGSPYPSFAFFVPPADSNTISSEWVVVRDTYTTVAASLGAALWNWAEFTGDVNSEIGDPYGWTTDNIHPSNAAHRAIGDFVTSQALLSINATNSSIPNIPNDYDFNITTGNINASLLTSGTINNSRLPSAATTITSVGTLSSLAVTGGVTASTFTGALVGNASTATNVAYSGLTGTVPTWNQNTTGSAATAATVTDATQSAITSLGTLTGVTVSGTGVVSLLRSGDSAAYAMYYADIPSFGLNYTPRILAHSFNSTTVGLGAYAWANTANAVNNIFGKSRGATAGDMTVVQSGDGLVTLNFGGTDGAKMVEAARISASVDGTPATNLVPGRIQFWTSPVGGTVGVLERMRIDNNGQVGIGATPAAGRNLVVGKNLTGSTASNGILVNCTIQSDVITSAQIIKSSVATVASAFTLATLSHFVASQGTIGSTSAVTTQHGYLADATLIGATNNYGFYGNIASTTGRWNIYMNGTAQNYFNGSVGIGITVPTSKLHVVGSFSRGAPVTKTGAFTLADTENWVICNGSATLAVTLPAASTQVGREITIKTIAAFTVTSATANVVPLAGGAAATAILPAVAGSWATLVSDGTNWIIMQS